MEGCSAESLATSVADATNVGISPAATPNQHDVVDTSHDNSQMNQTQPSNVSTKCRDKVSSKVSRQSVDCRQNPKGQEGLAGWLTPGGGGGFGTGRVEQHVVRIIAEGLHPADVLGRAGLSTSISLRS